MSDPSHRDEATHLTRRQFLGQALALGALGASAGAGWAAGPTPSPSPGGRLNAQRPNLLFVFSDQQAYDMLGCNGNAQIITPNADQMAAQGVRFTHCFSNSPVCTPYRGILMSGQHPLTNGCISNDVQLIPSSNRFGQVLKSAGYRTGYVGKWHIYGGDRNRGIPAGPHRHGFDDCFLSNNCTVDFEPGHCYYFNEAGQKVYFNVWEPFGQTQQALTFLDQCTSDQPFALFVSWHPPHDHAGTQKYSAPADLMAKYDPADIQLRPCAPGESVRTDYHGHMAMCTGVDQALGQLLAKLQEKGFAENTLVVYTSDHGDHLGSHSRPLPKNYPEEESIHVPLLMRWPGRLAAGQTRDVMIGALDLMQTILGLMDLPVPTECQGINLASPILSGNDAWPESVPLFIFNNGSALPHGWRGVRTRQYTYAFDEGGNPQSSVSVLYDNVKDPWQQTNLFGRSEMSTVQKDLHQMTLNWMKRFGDAFVDGASMMKTCVGTQGIPYGRPVDLLHGTPTAQARFDRMTDL